MPYNIGKLSPDILQGYFNIPIIKEAIYNASPTLYSELEKLYIGKITEERERERLILSFAKYCIRAQTRCTPYGLFASCSAGILSNITKLVIANLRETDKIFRHTRPDMNFLCQLSAELSFNEKVIPLLKFYPNTSIHILGNQIRYVEYKYINTKRHHQISSVRHTDVLQFILESTKDGLTTEEILGILEKHDISKDEALPFIIELIKNQLLISELEPIVTGQDYINHLLLKLTHINNRIQSPEISQALNLLNNLESSLKLCDSNVVNCIVDYKNMYNNIKATTITIEENRLSQIDLFRSNSNLQIGHELQEQLIDTLNFLNTITPKYENNLLKRFKENFIKRYENQEISLLEALDPETGIGYQSNDTNGTSELIDKIFPINSDNKKNNIHWTEKDQILLQKYLDAIKKGDYIINIEDIELESSLPSTSQLPYTMSIVFRIIDKNNKIFIQNWGGSTAVNIIGRFAHGDAKIENLITDIANFEKQQLESKIIAEVIHLPQSRVGNILQRPITREFEIPYLAMSTLPKENQIDISDLYISIIEDRIVLRSKRLNAEIIPRISCAHNYTLNSLPVYHFLGDLQSQEFTKRTLRFEWGVLENITKFLPRVEYKNTILSPATWKLNKKDCKILFEQSNIDHDQILKWRNALSMPNKILLSDDDNELLLDLDNEICINILRDLLSKRHSVTFTEFLFNANEMIVTDTDGNEYTNECIVVVNNPSENITRQKSNLSIHNISNKIIKQKFILGEEWLYYKIYCGIKTSDKLITEIIAPLTSSLLENKFIDKWFFIRYSDPDTHIRLRLHTNDLNNINHIIQEVNKYLIEHIEFKHISRIEIDTYVRELERYGKENIEISESYFFTDSKSIAQFISNRELSSDENIKWKFSLKCIDDTLNSFNQGLESKLIILNNLKEGFLKEHGNSKQLKIYLDNKYRNMCKDIDLLMNNNYETSNLPQTILQNLNSRRLQLSELSKHIVKYCNESNGKYLIQNIITSYIHMTVNRIYYSRQRTHELVLYYILYKYYNSRIAIEKKNRLINSN